MTRLSLTILVALTVAFCGAFALIRAQPHDDAPLRSLLYEASGCEAPCFLGIRPGETSVQEAVELLWAHEWVSQVRETTGTSGRRVVYWSWSGLQPDAIDSEGRAFFIAYDNIVVDLRVHTRFPLYQAVLLLGQPDWGYLFYGGERQAFYLLVFADAGMSLHYRLGSRYTGECAPSRWSASAELSFFAVPPRRQDRGVYDPCLRTFLHFSL